MKTLLLPLPIGFRSGFPRRLLMASAALGAFAGVSLYGQSAASASAGADKGVATLEKYFVNDGKVAPFSGANADIPRSVDDVQPYYVFDAKEIDLSGASTIGEFLELYLTMNSSSSSLGQSIFIGGVTSSVNLRGLGTDQTLILINGRRAPVANFALNGGGTQTNLQGIPMGMVDRIEVLPASAGAIYGGNAAGGVINVILKRNYTGGQLRAVYQTPADTDAPFRRVEVNYGFALEGGRTQVTVSAAVSDAKPLVAQDRSFVRRYEDLTESNLGGLVASIRAGGALPTAATPGIFNQDTSANLVLKNGGGPVGSPVTFVPYGIGPTTPADVLAAGLRANAGKVNRDQSPQSVQTFGGPLLELGNVFRTKSLGLTVRREMNSSLEVNLDFLITGTVTSRRAAFFNGQFVPAAAPTNPFTTSVWVFPDVPGDWSQSSNAVNRTLSVGFVQKLPRDWRLQGDYTWNSTNTAYVNTNVALATVDLAAAVNEGRLNPFLDTLRYPFDLSAYQGLQSYTGSSASNNVALRAAGPVWRLPAGAPIVRAGLERLQGGENDSARYVTYGTFPNRNTKVIGLGKNQTNYGASLEVLVPVVAAAARLPWIRQFDVQLAARADDYEVGTGTAQVSVLPAPAGAPVIRSNRVRYRATNPTYGFSYKPVDWLQLRASAGTGFTPPRYTQLVLDPTPSLSPVFVVDPKRGGARTPVFTIGGGNPNLEPQSTETRTVGAIIQPANGPLMGLRLSADYNFTRLDNVISSLGAQEIVDREAQFPERVVRRALLPGDPFGTGAIDTVNVSQLNLFKSSVETLDVRTQYRLSTVQRGTFLFSSLASFGLDFRRKFSVAQPEADLTNVSGFPLRYRGSASVTWDYRQWTVRWNTRFIPRYRVPGPPLFNPSNIAAQGGEYVAAASYSDFVVGYRFPERNRRSAGSWRGYFLSGAELQLGVFNVLNRTPPLDVSTNLDYGIGGSGRLRDVSLSLRQPF